MKLADVIGALRRRWYILVVGALVAAATAYGAWTMIPPEYERSASQLLLPGEATLPEDANPYLFVGGLYQVADILVRAIGPDDIAVATAGELGATISVTRDTAAGAVMLVTVSASSENGADIVLGRALALVEERLEKLQADKAIPLDERVDLVPLTHDSASVIVQKNRIMLTAVAGVAVLALGAGCAVLADTLIRLRRRSRTRGDTRSAGAGLVADADKVSEEATTASAVASTADNRSPESFEVSPDPVDDRARADASADEEIADVGEPRDDDSAESKSDTAGDDAEPEDPGASRNRAGVGAAGSRAPRRGRPVGKRRRNWQAPYPSADDDIAGGAHLSFSDGEREAG